MTRRARSIVVCLNNDGYEASLERRKIYVMLPDETAAKQKLLWVIDESGDDYLYPREYFAALDLPPALKRAVMVAA